MQSIVFIYIFLLERRGAGRAPLVSRDAQSVRGELRVRGGEGPVTLCSSDRDMVNLYQLNMDKIHNNWASQQSLEW